MSLLSNFSSPARTQRTGNSAKDLTKSEKGTRGEKSSRERDNVAWNTYVCMLCVEVRARVSIGPMNRKLRRGNLARAQKDVEELKRERFWKEKNIGNKKEVGGEVRQRDVLSDDTRSGAKSVLLFFFFSTGGRRENLFHISKYNEERRMTCRMRDIYLWRNQVIRYVLRDTSYIKPASSRFYSLNKYYHVWDIFKGGQYFCYLDGNFCYRAILDAFHQPADKSPKKTRVINPSKY